MSKLENLTGETMQERPSTEPRRAFKLQLMISEEERRAIDSWQFEHRMRSRAEAVRALVHAGLGAERDGKPK
jgi:hypothetical protein